MAFKYGHSERALLSRNHREVFYGLCSYIWLEDADDIECLHVKRDRQGDLTASVIGTILVNDLTIATGPLEYVGEDVDGCRYRSSSKVKLNEEQRLELDSFLEELWPGKVEDVERAKFSKVPGEEDAIQAVLHGTIIAETTKDLPKPPAKILEIL